MRDISIEECALVGGGGPNLATDREKEPEHPQPTFGQQVAAGGNSVADKLDAASSALGKGAEATGIVAGYTSLMAAAQAGADVPNDAAAVGLWAGSAALTVGSWVTGGLASGIRAVSR